MMRSPRGLTLIIGGSGPVKGLVAVELRDPALIEVVTNQASGFTAGDVVSVGGGLEYDSETQQNVAIAVTGRVSRIARAPGAAAAPVPAVAPSGAGLFGSSSRPSPTSMIDSVDAIPPLPQDFPGHVDGELVGLSDVRF
jgi:hypothetical protein